MANEPIAATSSATTVATFTTPGTNDVLRAGDAANYLTINHDGDIGSSDALTIGNTTGNITINSAGTIEIPDNVNATAGLDVSGAALTIDNQAITQTTGGQVTFAGTVDATNDLDVTGANLTVDADLSFVGTQAFDTTTGNIVLGAAGTSSTANVYIGGSAASTTPDLLIVGQKSDVGDPTGVEGAIYYNANTDKFYIYEGGGSPKWKEVCNKTDQACGSGTGSAWSALSVPTGNLAL